MLEIESKLKRQLEIAGLAIENAEGLRLVDLSERYACEELTIKRDLGDLRAGGIDIHSHRTGGIRLDTPLSERKLKELVAQYLSLCTAQRGVDNAVGLMVQSRGAQALRTAVLLQHCIERKLLAEIDYLKVEGERESGRQIAPLLLFQSERYWRVLAMNEGRIKQFHINKIEAVRPTRRSFRPVPPEDIEDMFRFSFKSWIGTEEHHIRLRLSTVWAQRLKLRQLFEAQLITEASDGTVILEATVNSIDEIASWVAGRGEGVTVVDPPELREKVLAIARGTLGNY